ncbi:MAG: hypothetical protein SPK76_04640 [Bacteroidales bacterium]|nr:hypothetical protein [Bacteroidales bacterium]
MKSKKGVIMIAAVAGVCALGLILSQLVDWPVSANNAGGDIAKSSRFSRKTAAESLTNMEELIANDEGYKNGITVAYVVMQTRAAQFAELVDLSNEAAGDIPAFAGVLKDMNAVRGMAENVNAQLAEAGEDLNAVLGGESRPELTQHTINASLAYTNLQKQNKLADRFIETADQYLKTAEADDQLRLVRDRWEEYQLATAALEGDEDAAEKLAELSNVIGNEDQLSLIEPLSGHGAFPLVIEQYNAFMQGHTVTDPEVSLDFSHGLPHQIGQLIDQTCKGFFSKNDNWRLK